MLCVRACVCVFYLWLFNNRVLKTTTLKYDWRTNLLSDVLAGLATSTMLVPQSISYALLVGIPPIYGLYTAFFPGLIYLVRDDYVSCVRVCAFVRLCVHACVYVYVYVCVLACVCDICTLSSWVSRAN